MYFFKGIDVNVFQTQRNNYLAPANNKTRPQELQIDKIGAHKQSAQNLPGKRAVWAAPFEGRG